MTSLKDLDLSKYYTYTDYLTWQFQERVELLLGKVAKMSPAPNRKHQTISWNLSLSIGNYLKNKPCQAFSAPFDVRLPISLKEGKKDTVVQPDICVICDEAKLDVQGCNGAPDIVVEILSLGNTKREMKDKFQLYEASLVKEYWIVDPQREVVFVYILENDKFIGKAPVINEDILSSFVLKDLKIDLSEVF